MNWYKPLVKDKPNSNVFIRELTGNINGKTCTIVDGGGTALYSGFQSSVIKKGNKFYEVPINYNGRNYSEGKKIKLHHFFLVLFQIIRGRII